MTKTIRYEERGRLGEVEFRSYPSLILATVLGNDERENFMVLFRYISGNNRHERKIPMTSPVITGEKIAMTAPVISDSNAMSFVMPSTYRKEEVPEPVDDRINIQEIYPRELAVIRFRGRSSDRDVNDARARLLKTLEDAQIRMVGAPFLMRYNPPFTPGFLRRNEVGVEIRRN